MLEVAEQVDRVHREGRALADAVVADKLGAAVPACPGWSVGDLVRHVGGVHRWARQVVRERLRERPDRDFGPPPGADLLDWYRRGLDELVDALRSASPQDIFWFWGPAPTAQAFWARRQANETAIHRRDAESAYGPMTPLPAAEAADGLDEFLELAQGRCTASQGNGRTVHLHATDVPGEWLVRLGDAIEVRLGHAKGDCAVRGPASDLFLWAMNRRSPAGLEVLDDESLLAVWAASIRF
jgi:uncharacterized protein (TIGR03083 family)